MDCEGSASRAIQACTVLLQGLVGSIPKLGSQISSKITTVSLQNTSLVQCNASHLAALHGLAASGEVSEYSCTVQRHLSAQGHINVHLMLQAESESLSLLTAAIYVCAVTDICSAMAQCNLTQYSATW